MKMTPFCHGHRSDDDDDTDQPLSLTLVPAPARMADVPDDGWHHFVCVEAANAGADCITLAPGGQHMLSQTLALVPYPN